MSGLGPIITYLKLRFKPIPWLILPILIYTLSIETLSQVTIAKIFFAYFLILGFRIYDDLMCIDYDKKFKEERFYFDPKIKKELLGYSAICNLISLAITHTIFNQAVFYLFAGLLFISHSLYQSLRLKKEIQFVSLLKYPFLVYCLSDGLNSGLIWAGIIFILFIIIELSEEKIIKQIKYLKPGLITFALVGKVIQWSLL